MTKYDIKRNLRTLVDLKIMKDDEDDDYMNYEE